MTLALSGMNTPEQVAENTRLASRSAPMTAKQSRAMRSRLKDLKHKQMAFCTGCGYCMPCPHGVDIPTNFRLVNQARLFGLLELSRAGFKQLQTNKQGDTSALACKKCGRCLPKCPNKIPIIDQLAETVDLLRV